MVKLKRCFEAAPPTSPLVKKWVEPIKVALGVIPFPSGDDSFVLKATYFRYNPNNMDIAKGEDVKVTVYENLIQVYINANCDPDGGWYKIADIEYGDKNPFAKAQLDAINIIADKVNATHGPNWCRIGNYKVLNIPSPYVDRLKAFCLQNPDIKVPSVASAILAKTPDSPEVEKTLNLLNGVELPPVVVKRINSIPDAVKPKVVSVFEPKQMTDRQRKNQLNKLINRGMGWGSTDTRKENPRVRKYGLK